MPAVKVAAASPKKYAKLPAGPPLDYCFMDVNSLKSTCKAYLSCRIMPL